ncbi:MAG: oligopeptide transporter, OPT family [Bacteroidales bacterium]|jgi:putative OPT family oligopeptide transporter|nr:oligopeptide transporter, OPT family [Bacteroidales bacterium]HOS46284.1 oligopeptide transporter, OPT family [Paludibacter sp.]
MSTKQEKVMGLPENASRELKPGEVYKPVMSPDKTYPEVNTRSVSLGLVMAVIFSAAAAYLGLKVGQVFEAAIPIAIIAVGLSTASRRKGALGENVIIQSIGASSGVVVAGAIFTLPALYILQVKYPEMTVSFMQVFLSSLLGGILGILFLIPFRKYFVSDMHGKYPFPEATATTQVLISGEKGGSQAKPLVIAGLIGGLYDFVIATFGTWSETFTSRVIPFGTAIADKAKLVFKINVGAAVLGLGYIVGLKYAVIICAGSALVWFVLIPALPFLSENFLHILNPIYQGGGLADLPPERIFTDFARHIGIGGIAMAGIIGIVKSWDIIKGAVGLAGKEIKGKNKAVNETVIRTQRDLPMKIIVIGVILTLIATFLFFYFGVVNNLLHATVGILVVAVIAFLFTTVAANAIAIVGTNPVSGMTLMTLILASVIMVAVGLKGTAGMVAALVIGGVVCTALSMAGGFITDLKIGYWLGSTPAKQQSWKFLGTLVSAATVGGVIIVLNKTYGFTGEGALVAPQANAMAAVIEPLMSGTGAPWFLYAFGAGIALLLTFLKIPALAFALGMFIPLELNLPLLVGGGISWFVSTRSKNQALNTARKDKGTLLASGFIAGGALMGVVSALIKFIQTTMVEKKIAALGDAASPAIINSIKESHSFFLTTWESSAGAQWLAIVMYAALIVYFAWDAMRVKP